MPRPKSHFRTGSRAGELRETAARYPVTKPDRTKLLRALEDALTDAGVWRDDTQVVSGDVSKRYATREPNAHVVISVQF
jgi:crossover junction endodeoxyribonuclease RusA